MVIAKITDMRMSWKAEDVMTARQYREANEWLSQLNCEHHIKKVVSSNYGEALTLLRKQVLDELHSRKYPAEGFEIKVVYSKVEDGCYWEPRMGKIGFEKVVDTE